MEKTNVTLWHFFSGQVINFLICTGLIGDDHFKLTSVDSTNFRGKTQASTYKDLLCPCFAATLFIEDNTIFLCSKSS